jgi:acyl-CoA synthetase (AMP-forming)/AMP-acid ligase II
VSRVVPPSRSRGADLPPFRCTSGELIRHAASTHGDHALAVLGTQRASFAEIDAASAQLARGLLASGVGKGTKVGLLGPNGPQWIVALLAASRIGATVTLLNTYHRPRELGWTLRHADIQVLLTAASHLDHRYLDHLETIAPALAHQTAERIAVEALPYLRAVWAWGREDRPWASPLRELDARADLIPPEMLTAVEAEVTPADPMVVVYSSGSTAEPKGAVHSQGAVVAHAHNLWQFRDLRSDDVIYTPMPLFWVGGLSYTLIAALHAGAALVFDERFEPGALLELIERERVTQVLGWPHMARALLEHPTFGTRDLSSLRGGTIPGLAPSPGSAPPRRRANSLGMTETLGPHTIGHHAEDLPPDKEGSFGQAVPGVEHRVVDPITGDEAAAGQIGELWVRGYSLMLGLHKRERHEVFSPDGWYPTGDGGWFDADGHLHFVGRLGDQIKTSGMNVSPREVELLLEDQPEVALAFVTGIPHAERGEDVVAAVVTVPGAAVDGHELRQRVKAEIATYKVPRHIEVFTDRSQLPWLDSGKADLRGIKALLAERYRLASQGRPAQA